MKSTRHLRVICVLAVSLLAAVLTFTPAAEADETAPLDLVGCDATVLADGDDANEFADIGFAINTGDAETVSQVYISENGIVSFDGPINQWVNEFSLENLSSRFGDAELIAPLFADAIRETGVGSVTYGQTTYGGRDAFCVNWNDLAPFVPEQLIDQVPNPLPTNSFQVVIVDRSDRQAGDFDIIVNYETIQWDDIYCPQGFVIEGDFEVARVTDPFECGCDFGGDFPCECPPQDEICFPIEFLQAEAMPEARLVPVTSSVFPEGESAGALAGVSFPQGFAGQTINFPGSGQVLAMVDDDGLASMSNDSLTPGRFVIEVRNGFMDADLGSFNGQVIDGDTNQPIAGAIVQVCSFSDPEQEVPGPVSCISTFTGESGQFDIVGVPVGEYELAIDGPVGTDYRAERLEVALNSAGPRFVGIIQLTGPTPVPDNVTFGPTSSWGEGTTVYWGEDLDLSVNGCAGGDAEWTLNAENGPFREGALLEGPPGTYTTTIPPLIPSHGLAILDIFIICPDGDFEFYDFDLYIDPSGTIYESDAFAAGSLEPVAGAIATLYRSDLSSGPFTVVPDGDVIMSPSNRTNPFTVSDNGRFGWDVIEGYYYVGVTADGCHAPGDPAQPEVRTDILPVEPEWLGLELLIDCNNAPTIEVGMPSTLEGPLDVADLVPPSTSDLDVNDVLTIEANIEGPLPLGETIVTWTVSDPDGASATTTQVVNVVDTTPPELTVPASQQAEATSFDGAEFTFEPTAVDSFDPTPNVACTLNSPVTVPLGSITVSCLASDFSGNISESGEFELTVVDTTSPEISLPAEITELTEDEAGAVVDYDATVSDIADPAPSLSCSPASGSLFPVGETLVTCDASDASNNAAQATFTVFVDLVMDVIEPEVTVPDGFAVDAASAEGTVVTFEVSAVDDVDGDVEATCAPASGTLFPIGDTTVTCTASDNNGNIGEASFVVTVNELPPVDGDVRGAIQDISAALGDIDGLSDRDIRRVDRALRSLHRADQDSYWESDAQLTDRSGGWALSNLRTAVYYMATSNSKEVNALAADLVQQMRFLAVSRLEQAEAEGGNGWLLSFAERNLDRGDDRVDRGYLYSASWKYSWAWQWSAWS